jgi:hypothetical protein
LAFFGGNGFFMGDVAGAPGFALPGGLPAQEGHLPAIILRPHFLQVIYHPLSFQASM